MKLTMNVPNDVDWRCELKHNGLLQKNLPSFVTDWLDRLFGELVFALQFDSVKLFDDLVNVHLGLCHFLLDEASFLIFYIVRTGLKIIRFMQLYA